MNITAEGFDFTADQITEAADTWAVFPHFCGETCHSCKKKANVLLSPGWICVCGAFNAQSFSGGPPLHPSPDLGPSTKTIKEAIGKSEKWQRITAPIP